MPTFDNNEVELETDEGEKVKGEVSIEFEVYCADCHAGICDHARIAKTYRRGMNRIDMELCAKCTANFNKEISERDEKIAELESQIEGYKDEIADLTKSIPA